MKLKNKIMSGVLSLLMLSSSLAALSDSYMGVKIGSVSTNKNVYGYVDGVVAGTYDTVKYTSMNLTGIEWQTFRKFDHHFLFGVSADVMFNNGDFIKGGTMSTSVDFGAHFDQLNVYGMAGYGFQSISSYAAGLGALYGLGVNYNLYEHMGVKIEYKVQNITIKSSDVQPGYDYAISGLYAGVSYKF